MSTTVFSGNLFPGKTGRDNCPAALSPNTWCSNQGGRQLRHTMEFPGWLQISYHSSSHPWKGNIPTLCLSHYLYHSTLTQFFNKQCMTLRLLLHSCYIYVCSLTTPCNRTLWYGQYTRGLRPPEYGEKSPNTFTSAAPRTYSIICIGAESCLGSIVGFARLPCFGTLRSVMLAKVALGELLRLCPSWAGLTPQ